ncbi:MAG: hypothetical protein ACP5JT_04590 [Thermoplasmata archaeon]
MLIKDKNNKDAENKDLSLSIIYDKEKNIENEIKEISLEITKIKNDLTEIKKSLGILQNSLSTLNVISTKISSIEFTLNDKLDKKTDEIVSTILTTIPEKKERKKKNL